tara:strand:+ start:396 stop:1031 length:636 start_codon:yes stop_codon:yes gene_type:complete
MIESFIIVKKYSSEYFILKRNIKSRYLWTIIVILMTLALISCSNDHLKNQGFNWENNQIQLQNIQVYTITGAVSLQSKEDSFLGNYKIVQENSENHILLTDFFGRSIFSSKSNYLSELFKASNLSLSNKQLRIIESLNFDLSALLLGKASFLPAQEMVFNEYGMLESILIPNHRIDYEAYIKFDNFSIPKKVIVSNELYEITFSLKLFEKI